MKTSRIIKFLFFVAVTLLIFYLLFQKVDYLSLKEVFLNVKWRYVILAVLVISATLFFSAKKWQAILKALDYPISLKDSFKIIMAAAPITNVTPGKAGDLIRAYYLKDKIPVAQVAGGVVTERLIDVLILDFYSFLGALILKNWLILGISSSIIFLIPLFFLLVNKIRLPLGRWRGSIENFLLVSNIFIRQPSRLLPILFYGAVLWLAPIFAVKILFLALGVSIPLLYTAAAFPVAIFISLIPVTIAGMGTRDSAIIYFFSPFAGVSVSLGVGLLYSLFAYWLFALLGLPFFIKKSYE